MESMGIFESKRRKTAVSTSSSKSRKSAKSSKSSRASSRSKTTNANDEDDSDREYSSADHNPGRSSILVSVVESRAREICVCKIDTSESSLMEIFLIIDGHSYNETILLLQDISPDEILLHDASRNKILSNKLEEEFNSSHPGTVNSSSSARILYISRQYFDQDRGAEMLKKITSGKQIDSDIIAKYIVLSAAYCLLKYIENCNGKEYAENSIRIRFDPYKTEKMQIDRRSSLNLELITNLKTGEEKDSLFSVVNYTKTSVGERLLKRSLLNPLVSVDSINCRLDVVEIFLRSSEAFDRVSELLGRFPDLDRMLNGLTYVPKSLTEVTARHGIDTLIFIKHTLAVSEELSEALRQMLEGFLSESGDARENVFGEKMNKKSFSLLLSIVQTLQNEALERVGAILSRFLSSSTNFSRSSQEMRYQACFALRSGVNGLLDVARKTYLQTVEEIYSLAGALSEQDGLPLRVQYKSSRGYFFLLPLEEAGALPPHYIQSVQNKRTVSCSTLELNSLSDRAHEKLTQAIAITNELIQEALTEVREEIEGLFRLVDGVALLDMLVSFADLVALQPQAYVRPRVAREGPLVLLESRHPVLAQLRQLHAAYVPNDAYAGPEQSVQVVTGPNGSGKTIYIKQVALCVVLAQVGSFVPASCCRVPIRDRLLTRLGASDDMENNLSTFSREMKETAYLLGALTPRSLVLIDELGRGTSNLDGLSLAVAVTERLVDSGALSFFVTHYSQVTRLADVYPWIRNVHLKTALEFVQRHTVGLSEGGVHETLARARGQPRAEDKDQALQGKNSDQVDEESRVSLRFLHEIGTGPCDMVQGYGILLGEMSGLPTALTEQARVYQRILSERFPLRILQDLSRPQVLGEASSILKKVKEVLRELRRARGEPEDGYEEGGSGREPALSCSSVPALEPPSNIDSIRKLPSSSTSIGKAELEALRRLREIRDAIPPDKLALMLSSLNLSA